MLSTQEYRRLTRGMRMMLVAASILVFTIGTPLYVLSTRTDSFFAWTIQSALSAAFLGGAYWSSGVLELLAAREPVWARARIAVPAVLLFTILTLIVTLLHLDKFHFDAPGLHTRIGTWAWLLVYALVPLLMGALLLRQRSLPGSDPPRTDPLPGWMRGLLGAQALVMFPMGVALLLFPGPAATVWPWALAPLLARAMGAWLLSLGVITAHAAWENDYQRIRSFSASGTLLALLQFVALARYGGEVQWDRPAAWFYVLFLLGILAVGVSGLRKARWDRQAGG